jgi:hypothetical protein
VPFEEDAGGGGVEVARYSAGVGNQTRPRGRRDVAVDRAGDDDRARGGVECALDRLVLVDPNDRAGGVGLVRGGLLSDCDRRETADNHEGDEEGGGHPVW